MSGCDMSKVAMIAWWIIFIGWVIREVLKEAKNLEYLYERDTRKRPNPPIVEYPKDHKGWAHLKG